MCPRSVLSMERSVYLNTLLLSKAFEVAVSYSTVFFLAIQPRGRKAKHRRLSSLQTVLKSKKVNQQG